MDAEYKSTVPVNENRIPSEGHGVITKGDDDGERRQQNPACKAGSIRPYFETSLI